MQRQIKGNFDTKNHLNATALLFQHTRGPSWVGLHLEMMMSMFKVEDGNTVILCLHVVAVYKELVWGLIQNSFSSHVLCRRLSWVLTHAQCQRNTASCGFSVPASSSHGQNFRFGSWLLNHFLPFIAHWPFSFPALVYLNKKLVSKYVKSTLWQWIVPTYSSGNNGFYELELIFCYHFLTGDCRATSPFVSRQYIECCTQKTLCWDLDLNSSTSCTLSI